MLLDVPGRVARLLLDMADENDGSQITKRVTHHMIAQMIGSSRETVSRTMRNMVDNALITASRKMITIQNRDALETAAGRSARVRARQDFRYTGQNDRRREPLPGSPPGSRFSGGPIR